MRCGIAISLFALMLSACTDTFLQPYDDHVDVEVDNLLQIDGQVCTGDPSETVFPVKVMFIVDCSGSMQFTDPSSNTISVDLSGNATNAFSICVNTCTLTMNACITGGGTNCVVDCTALCTGAENPGRQTAVRRVIDRFRNNPAVSFAIVRFNGDVVVNGNEPGCDGFSNQPNCLQRGIESLAQADITTDYEGALSTAYNIFQNDMLDADPVELTRTKYVTIFLSDGAPDPKCTAGCGNDPARITAFCDIPRDEWCEFYGVTDPTQCDNFNNRYPGVQDVCLPYNTNELIVTKVEQIMRLGEQFSVGEMQLNTGFLFIPNLPQIIQDLFGVDPVAGEALLQDMADAGGGFFRNFASGQAIDFLDINFSSIERPFGMTNFFVSNVSALPHLSELRPDSDGDGLDDTTEFDSSLGLDRSITDSDGDGYGDLLEYVFRESGYDPIDPARPSRLCADQDRADLDGDGLNACEERVLATDDKIADTDRDRIPDGVEFSVGMNPIVLDTTDDVDFDDKRSIEEVRIHADPTAADPTIHADFSYIYDVRELPERPDRKQCFNFTVRKIQLVTTLANPILGENGLNDVLVYFGEGPVDDPRDYGAFRAACVRARFVGGDQSFKLPADGRVSLTDEDFMPIPALMQLRQSALSDPALDPCVGVSLDE